MKGFSIKQVSRLFAHILFLCLTTAAFVSAGVPESVLVQKKAVLTIHVSAKSQTDRSSKASGSGFFISEDGLVVTNFHVVEKAIGAKDFNIFVKMYNGAHLIVEEVVAYNENDDIALLRVDTRDMPFVRPAKHNKFKEGESIIVIGSPLGYELTISDGIISRVSTREKMFQITAPISPGSSGSPVFNSKGEVIGVATASRTAGQNLNFAVPFSYAMDLQKNPVKVRKPAAAPPPARINSSPAVPFPTGSATFNKIKDRGTLLCGTKDSTPPFGYIHRQSGSLVGYDVDFCAAIADKIGVSLTTVPVTSANRIPFLIEEKVDILAATMTINHERAKTVDFSHAYLSTGQRFLVRSGTVRSIKDLDGKRIGTAKGSSSERSAKVALPTADIVSFDDYPLAFLALQRGTVDAVTTDEIILVGLLSKAPNKYNFEISNFQITTEPYGLAIRKNDNEFLSFINAILLSMERSGEAEKIYQKWFGPNSQLPMPRRHRIGESAFYPGK